MRSEWTFDLSQFQQCLCPRLSPGPADCTQTVDAQQCTSWYQLFTTDHLFYFTFFQRAAQSELPVLTAAMANDLTQKTQVRPVLLASLRFLAASMSPELWHHSTDSKCYFILFLPDLKHVILMWNMMLISAIRRKKWFLIFFHYTHVSLLYWVELVMNNSFW